MDTDYLTEEAYDVLIKDSYEVSDVLGAEIGAITHPYSQSDFIPEVLRFLSLH